MIQKSTVSFIEAIEGLVFESNALQTSRITAEDISKWASRDDGEHLYSSHPENKIENIFACFCINSLIGHSPMTAINTIDSLDVYDWSVTNILTGIKVESQNKLVFPGGIFSYLKTDCLITDVYYNEKRVAALFPHKYNDRRAEYKLYNSFNNMTSCVSIPYRQFNPLMTVGYFNTLADRVAEFKLLGVNMVGYKPAFGKSISFSDENSAVLYDGILGKPWKITNPSKIFNGLSTFEYLTSKVGYSKHAFIGSLLDE